MTGESYCKHSDGSTVVGWAVCDVQLGTSLKFTELAPHFLQGVSKQLSGSDGQDGQGAAAPGGPDEGESARAGPRRPGGQHATAPTAHRSALA